MPSMWFIVPCHGRLPLASICLRQLRRTCDALNDEGIEATAVVIADKANLRELRRRLSGLLGFGSVERDNQFLSRRFNDGCQVALDRPLPPREREPTHGEYKVTGRRAYRGNEPGTVFSAKLERNAEARAVNRGDIVLLRRWSPSLVEGSYTLPHGWDPNRAADFVAPCGSDDWVDYRIFLRLPPANTVLGFQRISFVREDGLEMTTKFLDYHGGSGIRVYPRHVMSPLGFRPADEDRVRACDTSILTNVCEARPVNILHGEIDPRQIVDWKSHGEQLNPYVTLSRHRGEPAGDPLEALADIFPAESLREMAAHYGRLKEPRLTRRRVTAREQPRRRKASLSLREEQ